jgi:hypothetical protein
MVTANNALEPVAGGLGTIRKAPRRTRLDLDAL